MGSMSAPKKVWFSSRNYRLAAHLYYPASGSEDRSGAAIIIAHPWASTKEQSPVNYALDLAQAGFFCLAYDAAYQGESEGEPRHLEDPYQRVEDIKSAVTYLTSLHELVDPKNIGVLGIGVSGGYAPFAAQTDLRIKACATSAGLCVGTMARRGFDKDTSSLEILAGKLQSAAADRNSDVGYLKSTTSSASGSGSANATPDDFPSSFKDQEGYYRAERAYHNRATQATVPRSWDLMGNFDAFAHNEMISPRPLLMITGSRATTKWYSEDGIAKAKEPKELFVIEGLTHADLYDHVDEAGAKCAEFFGKYLH